MDLSVFFLVEVARFKRSWVKFCFDHPNFAFVFFGHPLLDTLCFISSFLFVSNHMKVHMLLTRLIFGWFYYFKIFLNIF